MTQVHCSESIQQNVVNHIEINQLSAVILVQWCDNLQESEASSRGPTTPAINSHQTF